MDDPLPGITEKFEGVLEKIVYRNDENGYTVARLIVEHSDRPITVTGNLFSISPGESLRCTGKWVSHARFGRQFSVEVFEIMAPSTREGIVKYLSSGLVKGIGPKLAQRMVKRFGKDTLRIIEEEPERLREVAGIGVRRIHNISAAWGEHQEIQEIMVFLRSYGVGQALATRIYKHYGKETVGLIRENPYRLCDEVIGIGFKTADRIAANLGVEMDSPFRIRAVISHLLDQAAGEGHLCLPWPELVQRAAEATGCAPETVDAQIALKIGDRTLAAEESYVPPFLDEGQDRRMVFVRPLRDAEATIADRLRVLRDSPKKEGAFHDRKALDWAEKKNSIDLDDTQREAIVAALNEPVLVITGGPGVGKTTIIRLITQILKGRRFRCVLGAPTGRAAKRIAESTGSDASTIHRLLKFNPRTYSFDHDRSNPLPCDYVILDECSMIDVPLAARLLEAVPDTARILFVGDADQLPSVGPGNFLGDLIGSGRFRVQALTRLFRQKAEGGIITAAHAVNKGDLPRFTPRGAQGEIFFIEQSDAEAAAAMVVRLVTERIPLRFGLDPVRDIQVLTPMHKGPAGTEKLNQALRHALNPGEGGIARHDTVFRRGDKIMQTRNNYDLGVFNGDMGSIDEVDAEKGRIRVRFDERLIEFDSDQLDELVHSYCVSVHKSQGCEFPAVVLPLLTQHFLLLKRNLLYTGVTRARKLLVIVGTQKALRIAVGNDTISERYSLLEDRLKIDRGLMEERERNL